MSRKLIDKDYETWQLDVCWETAFKNQEDAAEDAFAGGWKLRDERSKKQIKQFYNLLKSRITGQVINGVLTGCLLQSELEGVYAEFTRQSNSDQSTDGK